MLHDRVQSTLASRRRAMNAIVSAAPKIAIGAGNLIVVTEVLKEMAYPSAAAAK